MSRTEPSAVINGNLLIARLWENLLDKHHHQVQFQELPVSIDNLRARQLEEDAWIVDAGGRQSAIAQQLGSGHRYSFGARCVLSQEVQLINSVEEDIYWIETVPEGWLFLAPLGNKKAILQAMVPLISGESSDLLAILIKQTRYIQDYIAELSASIAIFVAFPQILQPLSGKKHLAVGDAAFSVDPISGDGTGYAMRGAILATSVIDAIASGLSGSDSLKHYTLRLEKTFDAHLQQCLEYYLRGFTSSLWQREIKRMQKARSLWNPTKNDNFTHILRDFQLVKLEK